MQILSPEQIQEIKLSDYPITGKHSLAYALLKAQLEQDKAEIKRVFERIEKLNLFCGEQPEEGKPYQYLGCYILKWGRDDEPSLGLVRLNETEEYQQLKKEYRIDDK